MSRTTVFTVDVQWGDCDPADIVFFPNFQRWIDAASLDFFHQCGLPRWRELERTRGIIGTPMLEINTRFYKSATYGDRLEVHTTVERWERKVFVQYHRVMRDKTLLCDGRATRAFVQRIDGQLKAITVPEDIRAMCS